MLKAAFQLQPIYYLCPSADIREVRQNYFLIQRPHDNVRTETLRMTVYFRPQGFLRKINSPVKHLKPTIFQSDNTLPKIVCQVKKVNFPCMYLGGEPGFLQRLGSLFNLMVTVFTQYIPFDDRRKKLLQGRVVGIHNHQPVGAEQLVDQVPGCCCEVVMLQVCLFDQSRKLGRVFRKAQKLLVLANGFRDAFCPDPPGSSLLWPSLPGD